MKKIVFIVFGFVFLSFNLFSQQIDTYGAKRCGTFDLRIQSKTGNILQSGDRISDSLSLSYTSPSGKFLIHYTIGGRDGVDNIDQNNNGMPDFVDSVAYYLDFAAVQYREMGFRECPTDRGRGGSDAYDVYLMDIGNGPDGETTFGMTSTEDLTEEGFITYIILDNNYSKKDTTVNNSTNKKYLTYYINGIDALKITVIHEFHHAVQFSYGSMMMENSMLYEMFSTFMEYRFFPEIKYYKLYINKMLDYLLDYSFSDPDPSLGYAWSAFLIKLYDEYHNDAIFTEFWQLIGQSEFPFEALNEVLLKYTRKDLSANIYDMADWLYYTGKQAKTNPNPYFNFADQLHTFSFEENEEFSAPSVMYSGRLLPLTFYPSRIIFPASDEFTTNDTLDILMFNSEFPDKNLYNQQRKDFCCSVSDELSECDSILLNEQFCFANALNKNIMLPRIYERTGNILKDEDYVFPNPYTGNEKFIAFPVDMKKRILSKVKLAIYNLNNTLIYENNRIPVSVLNNRKVVIWEDINDDIETGVYLYKISDENDSSFGKFVIKKQKGR